MNQRQQKFRVGSILLLIFLSFSPFAFLLQPVRADQVFSPLLVAPSSAALGVPTEFSLSGFGSNDKVDLQIFTVGGGYLWFDLGTYTCDSSGGFTGYFTVPTTVPVGNYQFMAVDQTLSDVYAGPTSLLVTPTASITLASSSSGSPGDSIGFSLKGEFPNSQINVQLSGAINVDLGTFTCDGSGDYSGSFTIPVDASAGNYVVTATDTTISSMIATANLQIYTPTISLPSSVSVGGTVLLKLSGFSPNDIVDLPLVTFLGSPTQFDLGTFACDASGSYIGVITVPSDILIGNYQVLANDLSTSSISAVSNNFLATPTSSLTLAGSSVNVGGTLSFSLTGEFPNDKVDLTLSGIGVSYDLGTFTCDSSGGCSSSLVIPVGVSAGSYSVVAQDVEISVMVTSADVRVFSPLLVAPSSAALGVPTEFSLSGFGSNDKVDLQIFTVGGGYLWFDLGTFTCDSSGGFTGYFTVPTSDPVGNYQFMAVDQTLSDVYAGPTSLLVTPTASITLASSSSGSPGDSIGFSLKGEFPNSQINVQLSGAINVDLGTFTCDGSGDYSGSFTIPVDASAGNYVVTATDTTISSMIATANLQIYTPTISLPSSVSVGGTVLLKLSGFSPNDIVDLPLVTFLGSPTQFDLGTFACDASGSYIGVITVPSDILIGNYQVLANDLSTSSISAVSNNFLATPTSSLTLAGSSVNVGGTLSFSLTGEFPNDKVDLTLSGIGVSYDLGTFTCDSSGGCSSSLVIPVGVSAGSYSVVAQDVEISVMVTSADVRVFSPLLVAPSSAALGVPTEFSLSGFGSNDKVDLQIFTVGGGYLWFDLGTFTCDSSGGFTGYFTVPTSDPVGNYQFMAVDQTLSDVYAGPTSLLVTPTASITLASSSSGSPGDSIGFSLKGEFPNSQINVQLSGAINVDLGTFTCDGSGDYSGSFTIPVDASAGNYVVTATDTTISSMIATANLQIYTPTISLPSSVSVGGTVLLKLSGFSPNDIVDLPLVTFLGSPTQFDLGTFACDASGSYIGVITVPSDILIGNYQVLANDLSTSSISAVSNNFLATPTSSLTLAGSSVNVGGTLSFSLTGEFPNDKVDLTLSGIGVSYDLGTFTCDSSGGCSSSLVIPVGVSAGSYSVVAQDVEISVMVTSADVRVFSPLLVAPSSAALGVPTEFSLSGFGSNDKVDLQIFTVGGGYLWFDLGTFTCDSSGGFTGYFTVPTSDPVGNYQFMAVDQTLSDVYAGPTSLQVTPPNLFCAPEYALGSFMALIACFVTFGVYLTFKKAPTFHRLLKPTEIALARRALVD